MAVKKAGGKAGRVDHGPKKTSSSGNPRMLKTSTMNKDQKRNQKDYRGQGR